MVLRSLQGVLLSLLAYLCCLGRLGKMWFSCLRLLSCRRVLLWPWCFPSWVPCLEIWLPASFCRASISRVSFLSLAVWLVLLSSASLSGRVDCSFCVLLPPGELGKRVLLVFPCPGLPDVPAFGLLYMSCPFLSSLVLDLSGMSFLRYPLVFFQILAFPWLGDLFLSFCFLPAPAGLLLCLCFACGRLGWRILLVSSLP